MEEKNVDITNFLVVAFIVMVGVLIAKVATDFSQIKTSSYSRASEKKTISALKTTKPVSNNNNVDCTGDNNEKWFDQCIRNGDIACKSDLACGPFEAHDNTSYEKMRCNGENEGKGKRRCINLYTVNNLFTDKPGDTVSSIYCQNKTNTNSGGAVCIYNDTINGEYPNGKTKDDYDIYYTESGSTVECPVYTTLHMHFLNEIWPGTCYVLRQ